MTDNNRPRTCGASESCIDSICDLPSEYNWIRHCNVTVPPAECDWCFSNADNETEYSPNRTAIIEHCCAPDRAQWITLGVSAGILVLMLVACLAGLLLRRRHTLQIMKKEKEISTLDGTSECYNLAVRSRRGRIPVLPSARHCSSSLSH